MERVRMVDSRPYGKTGSATLAARHFFRRAVDAALFDHRPRALLADVFFLGSVCAPLLRTVDEGESKPSKGFAAWDSGRLSHGLSLVYRQLLLDLPDHVVLRRVAAGYFRRNSNRL